jgi:hypothetical protein
MCAATQSLRAYYLAPDDPAAMDCLMPDFANQRQHRMANG